MAVLALYGGTPVRADEFAVWPVCDRQEEEALIEVLRGKKWWRFAFGQVFFQERYVLQIFAVPVRLV